MNKRTYITDNGVLLKGYSYSLEEIHESNARNEILCMRLETHYECDLDCIYCYSYLRQQENNGVSMTLGDACDIIDQAKLLGVESIVYLGGGEPFLYSSFWELIQHMAHNNIVPVIFTNGMSINKTVAKRLYELGASIMIKMDGDEPIQNCLTGPHSYEKIHNGLEILMEAGFNKTDGRFTRLGIAPCVNKVNLLQIPDIWRFARKNSIFPNIEKATQIGRATSNITITINESHWLTEQIKLIDEKEFGINWISPYSSITGHSCGIYKAGVAVTVEKGVSLCPEMEPVSFITKQNRLKDILNKEEFVKARRIERNIDEPCTSCEYIKYCLGGCRSKALVCTGSIMGADKFCTLINEYDSSTIPGYIEIDIPCLNKSEIMLGKDSGSLAIKLELLSLDQLDKVERILTIHRMEDNQLYKILDENAYLFLCGKEIGSAKILCSRLNDLINSEEELVATGLFSLSEI